MDFDVSTFNPENMTDYQEDLKSLSFSPVEDWSRDFTYENRNRTDILTLGADSLYRKFATWLVGAGRTFDTNNQKLGVKITNLKIKGVTKGKNDSQGWAQKDFDFSILKDYFNFPTMTAEVEEEDEDEGNYTAGLEYYEV